MATDVSRKVQKLIVDIYKSGTHNFGRIASAVAKKTGQKVAFSVIAKALAGVRKAAPWKPKAKKKKAGPGRPPKKGRPSTGGADREAQFVLGFRRGAGAEYVGARSQDDLKTKLDAYLARGGNVKTVRLFVRRPVRIVARAELAL